MTLTIPGQAPELMYEPSFCNQALEAAGLDVVQPLTLSQLTRHACFYNRNVVQMDAIPLASSRKLRDLRTKARKTTAEVAAAVGLTAQTISQYETGKLIPEHASVKNIIKLSNYYGVPLSEIIAIAS